MSCAVITSLTRRADVVLCVTNTSALRETQSVAMMGLGKNSPSQRTTQSFSASFASAPSVDFDTFLVSTLAPK
jgi:hypothetical protein